MDIRGFIETSFLDWDGKVASVIFLPNCNFKCGFCSNGLLVTEPDKLPEVPFERVEDFIASRKDFIDGVVITGGEPTNHPRLFDIIKKLKALGVLIKLDTNGSNPTILAQLTTNSLQLTAGKAPLVDYIAMDLKAPLNEKYHATAGVEVDLDKIMQSIKLIMNSGIDYEFRTTVVPGQDDENDIVAMAKLIAGAQKFVLQQFVPEHAMAQTLRTSRPHTAEKLRELAEAAKKFVPNTITRGI